MSLKQFGSVINKLVVDMNKKRMLMDGVQYIADKVDDLNKKYNTTNYSLVVDIGEEGELDELNVTILYQSNPRDLTSVLQMSINVSNRMTNIFVAYINGIVGQITGNTIISMAKIFGCIIKAEQITLRDHSRLPNLCENNAISMIKLYILSTGMSWYNSKGFVSELFGMELEHNSAILSMNIVDFLEHQCSRRPKTVGRCKDDMNKFFDFFEKYNQHYPFLKDKGLVLTRSMTVQEFFTRIKEYILRNIPIKRKALHMLVCDHLNWLFVNIAVVNHTWGGNLNPYVIIYDEGLIYNLNNPISLPPQSKFRVKSNRLPTTRKTTSSRKRSKKSTTRRRRSIG